MGHGTRENFLQHGPDVAALYLKAVDTLLGGHYFPVINSGG